MDPLGNGGQIGDEIVDRLGREFGMILEGIVEIVDIGSVVLVVMDFHCACINVWLEGRKGVGKRRYSVGHRGE